MQKARRSTRQWWGRRHTPTLRGACVLAMMLGNVPVARSETEALTEFLPTGVQISPTAAVGAVFQPLNPDLPTRPDFIVGQAVTTATSPDGNTLLILTSGFNRNYDPQGKLVPTEANEYIFIYDIAGKTPIKLQVLQVPNTFHGLAWNPNGQEFYASGGVNDNIHIFTRRGNQWSEDSGTSPIALGHKGSKGLGSGAVAAGLAVNKSGSRLLVANFENDSVSVIDLTTSQLLTEVDLRPGKVNPAQQGTPGGEYPFWIVIKGDDKAYISSERDREVVVLDLTPPTPTVSHRVSVGGQPNKMILNQQQTLLYVANGDSDSVSVINTDTDRVLEEISTTASAAFKSGAQGYTGSNPNSLALSPDETTLYVTNGGTNSVAVIRLTTGQHLSRVIGLLPTGWYPNSVSLDKTGTLLYVINGKSNAGPNPGACRDTLSIAPGSLSACSGRNRYVWQLTKAGLLTMPVPQLNLNALTRQVARNNNFPAVKKAEEDNDTASMRFLQSGPIKHVIYIVKENRTYDQLLGDLEVGDGDPHLTLFPEAITPNHHALARQFVTLDRFFDSGEVSGDGWNWSTAARATDFVEKTVPVNYAGRGLDYDFEGTNRNINVGLATASERKDANPLTPDDPDLFPGATDVAAPDGPSGEVGAGYLWDAALRKGLTVRNYGFFGDLTRYFLPATNPAFIPVVRDPFAQRQRQFFPAKLALQNVSDLYFRGYDQKNADFWLYKEWEREFDGYVKTGTLPALEFVRFPHDHFGSFSSAIDQVDTPDKQMADNDYAIGLLVEKVAQSPYKGDTLIFIIEDDCQDGGDHVDAHRSVGYVVGPYVKQRVVVSKRYTTVNMLRTIEAVLGLTPLALTDLSASPMSDVFDSNAKTWTYTAFVPEVLRTTMLPLPPKTPANTLATVRVQGTVTQSRHDAAYWERVMAGQNFTAEDKLDTARFNLALWHGLMGEAVPYPTNRHGINLSRNRSRLLRAFWQERKKQRSPSFSVAQALLP